MGGRWVAAFGPE